MNYKRITQSVSDFGKLIPATANVYDYINTEQDWYLSTFQYNESQKSDFDMNRSVAGMTDVTTNKLWWDFDSKENLEGARQNTLELINRLDELKIAPEDISVCFSGGKGFAVEVNTTNEFTPKQVKSLALKIAQGLEFLDNKVYNANRIFRIIGTKHQTTRLYKTPLKTSELKNLTIPTILSMAKNPPADDESFRWAPVLIPAALIPTEKEVSTKTFTTSLDFSVKPKFLTNCRWALQNGRFKEGDRSTALLCLASTYKNLGFDLEHVYRMLKGTAELQARSENCDRFPDEEIYNNIILQVFGPHWNGGQYTCRDESSWLHDYCQGLSTPCDHKKEDELKPQSFSDLSTNFKEYVKNIDQNTIHTGLPSLDKYVFLSTGAYVGIIGAPGVGKTALALEILNNTSKAGVKSVFASLDMARTRIFEKLMYRITGQSREELYADFQNDNEAEHIRKLKEEFGNVSFFKKSSPTTQDIKEYVLRCQEESGEKVKLVMIDYFERVSTDMGDDTAASKRVSGELQDLVDELDVCLIVLVQPNKNALSGGPDSAIYDYTKIKGSSFVYQAFRIILSAWRPFYNPKTFVNDKYMQMAVLKNDLGELSEFAFNWEGKRGAISEMDDFQRDEFESLMKEKHSKEEDKSF